MTLKIAILGATGYTGVELVRLLSGHPGVKIVYLSSDSHAGSKLSAVHPQFYGAIDHTLSGMQVENIPGDVDLVFCALPHGHSATVVAALIDRKFRVIDLSADFRLKNPRLYKEWYDLDHPCPGLLSRSIYGLPELNRQTLCDAELVANPGCYPTGTILALAPLLKNRVINPGMPIIDAKSGVSGAGRTPRQAFHYPDCTENFKAYRVASHQHTPEIEQELGIMAGRDVMVNFTPHLVPMIRGILSTVYIELQDTLTEQDVRALYADFYAKGSFVRFMDEGLWPETRYVRGSNYIDIALKKDCRTGRLIIISAIDNLVKGASGQAVQNMNIMLGLPENLGLQGLAI